MLSLWHSCCKSSELGAVWYILKRNGDQHTPTLLTTRPESGYLFYHSMELHWLLCSVYCVLCSEFCILCSVYFVLCTVFWVLHVLCTVFCVLCSVICVLCTVCSVYCVLCAVLCFVHRRAVTALWISTRSMIMSSSVWMLCFTNLRLIDICCSTYRFLSVLAVVLWPFIGLTLVVGLWWRFGLVVTSLGVSTKLLYVEAG